MRFIYNDVTKEEYTASLMSYLRKRFKTIYPFDLPDIPKAFDGPNDIPLTIDELAELPEINKFYFSHLQKLSEYLQLNGALNILLSWLRKSTGTHNTAW